MSVSKEAAVITTRALLDRRAEHYAKLLSDPRSRKLILRTPAPIRQYLDAAASEYAAKEPRLRGAATSVRNRAAKSGATVRFPSVGKTISNASNKLAGVRLAAGQVASYLRNDLTARAVRDAVVNGATSTGRAAAGYARGVYNRASSTAAPYVGRARAAATPYLDRVAASPLYAAMRSATGAAFSRASSAASTVREFLTPNDAVLNRIREAYGASRNYVGSGVTSVRDYVTGVASRRGLSRDAAMKWVSERFALKFSKNAMFDYRKIVDPASKYGKKAYEWTKTAAKWTADKSTVGAKMVSKYSGIASDAFGRTVASAVDRGVPFHITKGHVISNFVKNSMSKAGLASGFALGGLWEGLSEFYKFASDRTNTFSNSPEWTDYFRLGEVGSRFVNKTAEVASDWCLFGLPRLIPGVNRYLNEANDYDYMSMSSNEDEYRARQEAASRLFSAGIDVHTGKRLQVDEVDENGNKTGKRVDISDEELQRWKANEDYIAMKAKREEDKRRLLTGGDPDSRSVEHYLRVIKAEHASDLARIDRDVADYDSVLARTPVGRTYDRDTYRALATDHANKKYELALQRVKGSPAASRRIESNRAAARRAIVGGSPWVEPDNSTAEAVDEMFDSLDPADQFNFNVDKFRAGAAAAASAATTYDGYPERGDQEYTEQQGGY